jgi:predicted N-acetyltransferase YhbS
MVQSELDIRSPSDADLLDMAVLLIAGNFGDDAAERLRAAFDQLRNFSLVAMRGNRLEGVLLATFNGWHVFASHLAVTPSMQRHGIGRLLVAELLRRAVNAGAKGLIVDSRLSAVGFFQKLDFRLPGAVFLVKDVRPAETTMAKF